MFQDKMHLVKKYVSFCIFLLIVVGTKKTIRYFFDKYHNTSDIKINTNELNEYYQQLLRNQQIDEKNKLIIPIKYKKANNKSDTSKAKVNINDAKVEDFMSLGIDNKISQRIIKYRKLLGGYINIDQLYEVYGFKKYEKLKDYFFIKSNFEPTKIDITKATIKELLKHPYISYEESKKIYNLYNNSNKNHINDMNQLLKIFDKITYNKVIKYLSVDVSKS